jgi:hypothetical protein
MAMQLGPSLIDQITLSTALDVLHHQHASLPCAGDAIHSALWKDSSVCSITRLVGTKLNGYHNYSHGGHSSGLASGH